MTEPGPAQEGEDDLLAAEYALGLLPGSELAALARRLEIDPAFAKAVLAWEERFAPMAEGYLPQDLPPNVKAALDRHLFGVAGPQKAGFWANLALWRGLAAGATAALVLALVLPLQRPLPQAPSTVMASLSAEASEVHYMAVYDASTGMVRLAHLAGAVPEGQVFQLWVLQGDDAPVSLGVIPTGATARMAMDDRLRPMLTSQSHLAISLEPLGGSPTDQPSGPVVALGDLQEV
ncbi:anti-sigma factor [Xinfangfangia sp. CPCC 101601]|uniref:Anti-sigma factor n=2 Tax=Pseudogemmobacter lacusdianii TaxID=3069608 RepID=A0ABU0W1R0_9RHOB|nr:anti-sigma factor [Xinfangfangia sp. CPCC 101601]